MLKGSIPQRVQAPNLKGPCSYMVGTWALKEFLYLYFGVYVGTRMVLGPFGQYLRTLIPKTIPLIAFGPESLNIGYLDPLGTYGMKRTGDSYATQQASSILCPKKDY